MLVLYNIEQQEQNDRYDQDDKENKADSNRIVNLWRNSSTSHGCCYGIHPNGAAVMVRSRRISRGTSCEYLGGTLWRTRAMAAMDQSYRPIVIYSNMVRLRYSWVRLVRRFSSRCSNRRCMDARDQSVKAVSYLNKVIDERLAARIITVSARYIS